MQESLFGGFRQRSPKETSRKNNTETDFLNLSGFHHTAVGVFVLPLNSLKLRVPRKIPKSERTYVDLVPNISPIPSLSRRRGCEAPAVLLKIRLPGKIKVYGRFSGGEKCLAFPGRVPVFVPSGAITHHCSRPVAKHRFRC